MTFGTVLATFVTPFSLNNRPLYLVKIHKKNWHLNMLNRENDVYEYVHSSIRDVLTMKPERISDEFLRAKRSGDTDSLIFVNGKDLIIKWDLFDEYITWRATKSEHLNIQLIPMASLVTLASQCELALFRDDGCSFLHLPSPISGLLNVVALKTKDCSNEERDAHFFIATTIALNMVENSIRHLTGKRQGRAPLLKDMIELIGRREGQFMVPKSLVVVLKSLLLPNDGLNLRNLLWHGFLPGIKRRWFALALVLTISIDDIAGTSSFESHASDNHGIIEGMSCNQGLLDVIYHGRRTLSSVHELNKLEQKLMDSSFIPRSHHVICRAMLNYVNSPVMFASIATPLIEHALRILWCRDNKQNKCVAAPGSYYVTLDGHGQRDKHDIVLMPFMSHLDECRSERENLLVHRLGGPTMALLIDIFASPPGAPNIRASVAHGLFNADLFQELNTVSRINGDAKFRLIDDMTSVLIATLEILSDVCNQDGKKADIISHGSISIKSYRPYFSYSALLLSDIDSFVDNMDPFYKLINDGCHLAHSNSSLNVDIASKMAETSISIDTVLMMQARIYERFGIDKTQEWTTENCFQDHRNNLVASECGAARLLLSEISIAASTYLEELGANLVALEERDQKLSSRRRKQISRICSTAQLTLDFYSFAAYCALTYIERRQSAITSTIEFRSRHDELGNDILFLAVKRSRMVVSTWSTMKSLDRGLKALEQYVDGKAVIMIRKDLMSD